ncbi:MAG: DUF6091 family protein [Aquabacterium sp.]
MRVVVKMAIATVLSATAWMAEAVPLKFCVFDVMGTGGEAYSMSRDYVIAMQRNDVDIELKAYLNEGLAAEDYRAGRCDALLATAFRTRPFNPVAASTDTIGATTVLRKGMVDINASYDVLRKLVQTYATPSPLVSRLMINGEHEVGGVLPIGPAYPFVNDRRISSLDAAQGKRVAALEYDRSQAAIIQKVGAIPVPVDITNVHLKFNSGQVDVVNLPTLAFLPLELQRGMGKRGGVARFPLMIVTYQMVFRRSKLPEGFGQVSRSYWLSQFDRVLQLIRNGDATIPPSAWIDIGPEDSVKYVTLMRDIRIQLAQEGFFDKRGLKILKRIRCHVAPEDTECKTKQEED